MSGRLGSMLCFWLSLSRVNIRLTVAALSPVATQIRIPVQARRRSCSTLHQFSGTLMGEPVRRRELRSASRLYAQLEIALDPLARALAADLELGRGLV
jgi:hypothetical protein